LPFIIGAIIGALIIWRANLLEFEKTRQAAESHAV